MVIFTLQHMCQILQQITEGDLEACIFFPIKIYIFSPKLVLVCLFIMDQLLCGQISE